MVSLEKKRRQQLHSSLKQGLLNWSPANNASLMDHVRIYSFGKMSTSKMCSGFISREGSEDDHDNQREDDHGKGQTGVCRECHLSAQFFIFFPLEDTFDGVHMRQKHLTILSHFEESYSQISPTSFYLPSIQFYYYIPWIFITNVTSPWTKMHLSIETLTWEKFVLPNQMSWTAFCPWMGFSSLLPSSTSQKQGTVLCWLCSG